MREQQRERERRVERTGRQTEVTRDLIDLELTQLCLLTTVSQVNLILVRHLVDVIRASSHKPLLYLILNGCCFLGRCLIKLD